MPSYPQRLVNQAAQQPQQLASYPQQVLSHAAQDPQSPLHYPGPPISVSSYWGHFKTVWQRHLAMSVP